MPHLIDSINKSRAVILVEGEKDADNLNSLGFSATTLPGGARKWRPSYKRYFKNSDLILIPDNDHAGISGMEITAESLEGTAKRIRILKLTDLKPKQDVSDWLRINGCSKSLLDNIIQDSAEIWCSSKKTEKTGIDKLNEEFGVLTLGNKVVILWERRDEFRFLAVQDFRILLKNKSIDQLKASEYFLDHPERREYTKIDMLPGMKCPSGCPKPFQGFSNQGKGRPR